jgi:hypothetical protein
MTLSVLLHSVPIFVETLEKLVHHFDRRRWSYWAVARPSVSIRRLVTVVLSRSNGDTHTENIIQEMEGRERRQERNEGWRCRERRPSQSQVLLLLLSRTQRRQSAQSGVSRETAAI